MDRKTESPSKTGRVTDFIKTTLIGGLLVILPERSQ